MDLSQQLNKNLSIYKYFDMCEACQMFMMNLLLPIEQWPEMKPLVFEASCFFFIDTVSEEFTKNYY